MEATHPTDILTFITQKIKRILKLAGVFSLFINLLMLSVPLYMLQIFDRVLASHSTDTLIYLSVIVLFALVVFALLDAIRARVLISIASWADATIMPCMLKISADAALQGNTYAQQVFQDITAIRQFLSSGTMGTLFDVPWVPLYLGVIFMLHPFLGLIALIGSVLLFLLGFINQQSSNALLQTSKQELSGNRAQWGLCMQNAESVQGMGMMKAIESRWIKSSDQMLHDQMRSAARSAGMLSTSKFLRLVLQVAMLGTGAYLVLQGQFTPGMMIAGTILAARALAPAEQAIGMWWQVMNTKAAYRRIKDYLDKLPPERLSRGLPAPAGKLVVKNMTFQFNENQPPILENINLTVEPGECLVIAGSSGAGKTTLARLIVGAYQQTRGEIRLDGADIYTWDRDELGQYLGYLPQQIDLFVGTIRDNIARLQEEATEESVVKAAQASGAHQMILQFPQGYDTPLPDAGRRLSGGQRQRIALARALFAEPQLIVLDEPTSNMDMESQQLFFNLVKTLQAAKKTLVIITHHPQLIEKADKILLRQQGKTVLYGSRDTVLGALKKAQEQQQNAHTPKEADHAKTE